jgi:hypothetical protein
MDRRQGRPKGDRGRGVVKSDDGEFARHVEVAAMGDRHRRGGHVVIAGEDRRRRRDRVEQLLGRRQSRREAEIALGDRGHHAVGLAHGRIEARQALGARRLIRIAQDESQAAMPRSISSRVIS